jgi:hypothetical protein
MHAIGKRMPFKLCLFQRKIFFRKRFFIFFVFATTKTLGQIENIFG